MAAKFSGFNDWTGEFNYSEIIDNPIHSDENGNSSNQKWENYKEIQTSEIQHLLPVKHPDLINNINDFPEESCYFDDDDVLLNYLIKNNYTRKYISPEKSKINQYLKWDCFQYWYITLESLYVKNYTTRQINQLINYNTNQNGKNTLQSVETENSRPNHIGTIAIRRGKQQITVGNRPNGNKTVVKIGRTEINSIKICKNIVQSANY
jgi:hypothetical protein